MKVSYFPGCTLRTKAKELDAYARKSAEALGVVLEEVDNWQCCGGVFTTASDEIATKLSSVRALANAQKKGQPLVSVCSACHNVIKQTNHAIKTNPEFASKVNRYMAEDTYSGETEVLHYLELLRDKIGFEKVKEAVAKNENNPLKGKKIGAYYGCLLLRPNGVMQMDDPENPKIIEDLISAIGATPVIYPYRNECCGGYIAIESPADAKNKSNAIMKNADSFGVDMVVTACPLCRYNLDKSDSETPVVYFTELLALALGVAKEDK